MPIVDSFKAEDWSAKGLDQVLFTQRFHCSVCGEIRKAVVFTSGLVLDIQDNQMPAVENVVVDQPRGRFKNVYFVPEVTTPNIRRDKIALNAAITSIMEGHTTLFHQSSPNIETTN